MYQKGHESCVELSSQSRNCKYSYCVEYLNGRLIYGEGMPTLNVNFVLSTWPYSLAFPTFL